MFPRPPTAILALLCVCLILPRSAGAQGPQGHVAYIYPAGGQQGKTVEITVGGTDLEGAKGVRVTGEGVTGKVLKVEKQKTGMTAAIEVTIAPDTAPGQRDLRLLTPGGVTNRARFVVGQMAEVLEKEPNSTPDAAETLPALPVVVNGQVFEADKDFFRFSAKAGQTIVCRVEAQQLLPFLADGVPGWFQAVLTLYDASGKSLAYVDDFRFHPDPVLIYQVERDGEYVVEIRDSIFRGREDFVYRLSIGELPFLTHVYPLGAKRQTAAKLDLFGANLPAKQLSLKLGPDDPPVRQVQLGRNGILSNELPFAIGELPEVQEREPNNTPEQAQPIEVPVTINGRIQERGDVDCFAFTAEAQQKLVMEVHARRLESPLDSSLTLLDPRGEPAAQNDDWEDECSPYITHHADSRLVHTFKLGGKYVLKIGDIQGKGGQEFAYRLTISPPRPDFELRVTPDNPRVGQGATTVVNVQAIRRDGFSGQIDLSVENLPKGFTASGTAIPEGVNDALVSVTAPSSAPLGTVTPSIVGRAVIDEKTVTRKVLPAEDVMQAFYYHHLLPTREFLLTLLEPAPFKLIPQLPPEGYIRFGAGRTAFLVMKAERTQKAKGPIRLALSNAPKGIRMQSATIPADADEAKLEIRIPNQLPATVRYNLIIAGTIRMGKDTLTSISPAVLALGPSAPAPQVAKPGRASKPATTEAPKTEPPKTEPAPKPRPKKAIKKAPTT